MSFLASILCFGAPSVKSSSRVRRSQSSSLFELPANQDPQPLSLKDGVSAETRTNSFDGCSKPSENSENKRLADSYNLSQWMLQNQSGLADQSSPAHYPTLPFGIAMAASHLGLLSTADAVYIKHIEQLPRGYGAMCYAGTWQTFPVVVKLSITLCKDGNQLWRKLLARTSPDPQHANVLQVYACDTTLLQDHPPTLHTQDSPTKPGQPAQSPPAALVALNELGQYTSRSAAHQSWPAASCAGTTTTTQSVRSAGSGIACMSAPLGSNWVPPDGAAESASDAECDVIANLPNLASTPHPYSSRILPRLPPAQVASGASTQPHAPGLCEALQGVMHELGGQPGDVLVHLVLERCDCNIEHAIEQGLLDFGPEAPASISTSELSGEMDDSLLTPSPPAAGLVAPGVPLRALAGVVQLMRHVAKGLEYLHSQGIVHGNLKPSNVLLQRSQDWPHRFTAKLADYYGMVPGGQPHQQQSRPESLRFMALEVIRGSVPNKASDVYSFGLLLQYVCTRRKPFGNLSPAQIMRMVQRYNISSCTQWPAHVPGALRDLVRACNMKDPRKRPTASSVRQVLHCFEYKVRTAMMHQQEQRDQVHPPPAAALPCYQELVSRYSSLHGPQQEDEEEEAEAACAISTTNAQQEVDVQCSSSSSLSAAGQQDGEAVLRLVLAVAAAQQAGPAAPGPVAMPELCPAGVSAPVPLPSEGPEVELLAKGSVPVTCARWDPVGTEVSSAPASPLRRDLSGQDFDIGLFGCRQPLSYPD